MTYRMSSFLGKSTRYPPCFKRSKGWSFLWNEGWPTGERDGERPGIRRSWGGLRGMNGRIENWGGPRFTVKNWEKRGLEGKILSFRLVN